MLINFNFFLIILSFCLSLINCENLNKEQVNDQISEFENKSINPFIEKVLINYKEKYKKINLNNETPLNNNLEVVICAIAKMENDYINDWCKYHLNMGFSEIYIFDNNDEDYEPIENRIDKNIISKIHIFKVPGKQEKFQRASYSLFTKYFNKNYNWCAYIDIDEFIVLKNWRNIKEFLNESKFNNAEVIKLEWHIYGDNDEIKQDISIPIYERITKETNSKFRIHQSKGIVRGNKEYLFTSSHFPSNIDESYCNQVDINGKSIKKKRFVALSKRYEDAYIAHYMTKTLDEFMNQKFLRIEQNGANYKGNLMLSEDPYKRFTYYFKINQITTEKVSYIKEKININILNSKKLKQQYKKYKRKQKNKNIKKKIRKININKYEIIKNK